MLLQQTGRHRFHVRVKLHRLHRHLRHDLQRKGIFHRLLPARPPNKRPVILHQHGAHLQRIDPRKAFHDHVAGFPFVIRLHLLRRHRARHGNLAVKIIAMRRAKARDSSPRLRKRHRIARMRVNHRANPRKRQKQPPMRGRIGRRPQRTLHNLPLEIDHHHIVRLHGGVIHPARLDGKHPARGIPHADIAERQVDEFVFRQEEIRLVALGFQVVVFAHKKLLVECAF